MTGEGRKIKDLPPNVSLRGVRFVYPGDNQPYYYVSQWDTGVWGRKSKDDDRVVPLACAELSDVLEWDLVEGEDA
jgi:hypothetical protein